MPEGLDVHREPRDGICESCVQRIIWPAIEQSLETVLPAIQGLQDEQRSPANHPCATRRRRAQQANAAAQVCMSASGTHSRGDARRIGPIHELIRAPAPNRSDTPHRSRSSLRARRVHVLPLPLPEPPAMVVVHSASAAGPHRHHT